MASVLNRSTKAFHASVNTPDFPVQDWIIGPDLTAVIGFDSKYWIITGDVITLMDQAARDAVDAAELASTRDSAADQLDQVQTIMRAFAETVLDEFNAHALKINAIDAGANASQIKANIAAVSLVAAAYIFGIPVVAASPVDLLASNPIYRQPVVPKPASFAARCASDGVIFCDPMEDAPVMIKGVEARKNVPCRTLPEAISPKCKYRSWRWVRHDVASPIIDESTKADGIGSLRLTYPSNSTPSAGGYYNSNFSPDLLETFDEGEPFFVQFRVRYSCQRIWKDCDPNSSSYKTERRVFASEGGGHTKFKIAIIEVGDVPGAKYPSNHCEWTQIVLNHGLDHAWNGFHSCGWYTGFDQPLDYKPLGSRQIDRQPVISSYANWPVRSPADADRSRECLWLIPDPWRKSQWGDVDPNCIVIDSEVWYTVTQQVIAYWQPGRKDAKRSLYRLWIQSANETPALVIEQVFFNRGPEAPAKKYGKIVLLQHSTGKDPKEKHPPGHVWYDSVIVSREMIPPAL